MTPSIEYRAAWAAAFDLAHRGHAWDGFQRNAFFLNCGAGRFVDASAATGLNFIDDGRSFAIFDYDGDGDADLIIRNRTGPQVRLLRNEIGHRNPSLALRLRQRMATGMPSEHGLKSKLPRVSGPVFWAAGPGFLAQHSKELIVGLGSSTQSVKVKVRWPSGSVSEFTDLSAGNRYYLVEGQAHPRSEPLATSTSAGAGGPAGRPATCRSGARAFSTALVDPLPMPSFIDTRLFDERASEAAVAPARPGSSTARTALRLALAVGQGRGTGVSPAVARVSRISSREWKRAPLPRTARCRCHSGRDARTTERT